MTQKELPGTMSKRLRAVEVAAQLFLTQKESAAAAKKKETAAKDDLIGTMRKNRLDTYRRNGFVISLDSKDTVKVEKRAASEEDEEEATE